MPNLNPVVGPENPTLFGNAISDYVNSIDNQNEIIANIAIRLNKILDRTGPLAKEQDNKPQNFPDFLSRLNFEHGRLYENNTKLQRIVEHLSELI